MRRTTVLCSALLAWLACSASASAQEEKPEPPERIEPSEPSEPSEPAQPAESQCFPRCRQGYVCQDGQCVAQQQPPPPPGQSQQPPPPGQPQQPPPDQQQQPPPPGQYQQPAPHGQPAQGRQAPPASDGVRAHEGGQWVEQPSGRPPGVRSPRFAVGFHVGGLGTQKADGFGDGSDFQPTYGIFGRFDFPIGDYVALGPAVFFGAWNTEEAANAGWERSYYIDIDFMIRGRLPVPVGEEHFDLYVGVPVGFSAYVVQFNDDAFTLIGDRGEYGWNVGAVAGAQMFFSRIGVMAELGWRRHTMATVAPEIYWDELVFGVGLVLRFGS